MTKIKLGFYPYTYVRTNVMRSKLLKKEDYHKLMKMGIGEITRYLGESDYKKEIDELAATYSGSDFMEIALNKNLVSSFLKLKRISPDELNVLISAYLKRNDIWNIKTILRAKYAGEDEETVKRMLVAVGELDEEFLLNMFKKETIEDILRNIPFFQFKKIKPFFEKFKEKNILVDIENALDKYYYKYLMDFTETLPEQGGLFKGFLESEVEVLNILMIIRLKKEGVNNEDIKNYLILTEDKIKDNGFLRLLNIEGIEAMPEKIQNRELAKVLETSIKKYKETKTLTHVESALYKYFLKKSILLLHQHPLSLDVILGYMFAKEIEVKNLKTLVKGKQLGMSEEFIEQRLVI
ncbi:ATP synthase A1 subunit C [Candidatus Woesearchaeota archaeon]|nr:ATP synthase A1 subunit C [Candidatus Woesearchaeota archaeon]